MYADRYARPGGIKPGSLAVAVGINAAVIAALVLSSPTIVAKLPKPPLILVNIDQPPPPKPVVPDVQPKPHQTLPKLPPERVDLTPKLTEVFVRNPIYVDPGPPPTDPGTLTGTGSGGTVELKPIPPVFVGSQVDPRYVGSFQPDYPAGERRAEREGVVHVKVLIGVDGRVKQVARVDATSDAFFRATEQQALGKWRFKPATRDGIPVESWRTMSVTFVLKE